MILTQTKDLFKEQSFLSKVNLSFHFLIRIRIAKPSEKILNHSNRKKLLIKKMDFQTYSLTSIYNSFSYKTRSKRFWSREKSKSNDFLALQCTHFQLKTAHFSKFRSKLILVNSFYMIFFQIEQAVFTIILRKQIFLKKNAIV